MRIKSRSRVVALAIPLITGCITEPDRPDDTIPLGAVLPLTGTSATTDLREALQLAVDEINEAGGVLEKALELRVRDDNSDVDRAKTAAAELADAKVPVIFGEWASSVTLELAKVTAERKVVQITGASTSPLLTTFEDDGYLYRTIASDTLQGNLLAKRALEKGFDSVAVIHIPGAYGEGLAQSFSDSFTAAGGSVSAKFAYTEGRPSQSGLINQVMKTEPQAVLLVAYPADGAQIMLDWLDSAHVDDTFWFFTDALQGEGFVTAVGEGRFTFRHEGSGPGRPNSPRYEKFRSAFQARYGRDPGAYAANFYDAAFLAALGLQAAGTAEGSALKEHLSAVSVGGQSFGPDEFTAAIAALRGGADVNFEGASGPVDFDENGDVVASWDIWVVEGGDVRVTETAVTP